MSSEEPENPVPEPPKQRRGKRVAKSPPITVDNAIPNQVTTTKTESISRPPKTVQEIRSRLRRREAKEKHDLFQEKVVLIALIVFSGVAFLGVLAILTFSANASL